MASTHWGKSVHGWQADKRWSDRFLTEIKGILGTHLIAESPVKEDQERNTDLIVLRMDAIRIGCRVRRADKYFAKYANEFTIRTSRPKGTKTELAKLIEGWGDYFFYGFGDDKTGKLVRWGLGDLRVFRLWFNSEIVKNNGELPGIEQTNRDNSSNFRAFSWTELPASFCIATSWAEKNAA